MKKIKEENKKFILHIIFILFITITVVAAFEQSVLSAYNTNYATKRSTIEYINSTTQRLVKMELSGTSQNDVMNHLNVMTAQILPDEESDRTPLESNEEFIRLARELDNDLQRLVEGIQEFETTGNSYELLFTSERHYYNATNLTSLVSEYSEKITTQLILAESTMLFAVVMSFFVLWQIALINRKILRRNEMRTKKQVDMATGVYNRLRCLELMKQTKRFLDRKYHTMIVFDVMGLKEINVTGGHHMGDDVVYNFAQALLKAADLFELEIFVGRFSGDTFLIYYADSQEVDVHLYKESVAHIIDETNRNVKNYHITYQVGWSTFSKKEAWHTLEELYQRAHAKLIEQKQNMNK